MKRSQGQVSRSLPCRPLSNSRRATADFLIASICASHAAAAFCSARMRDDSTSRGSPVGMRRRRRRSRAAARGFDFRSLAENRVT